MVIFCFFDCFFDWFSTFALNVLRLLALLAIIRLPAGSCPLRLLRHLISLIAAAAAAALELRLKNPSKLLIFFQIETKRILFYKDREFDINVHKEPSLIIFGHEITFFDTKEIINWIELVMSLLQSIVYTLLDIMS